MSITRELSLPDSEKPLASYPAAPGRMSPTVASAESALADAAQSGDLVAFGLLYHQWFPRIYDFVARVARNSQTAEEVAADTFLRAIDELDDPVDVWPSPVRLFAIAHELAIGRSGEGSVNGSPDVAGGGADAEWARLTWEGTALLGDKTYAVVDLSVRRGLSDEEVGAAAGIRQDLAVETVAHTKERAAYAVSIYVLVKKRVTECSGLRGVVGAHANASLGADLAEVVGDHLQQCSGCARAWQERPSPLEVIRRLPAVTPPVGVRDRIWARARRRYRWAGPGSTVRRMRAASVAACIALVLGTVAMISLRGDEVEPEIAASPNLEMGREDVIAVLPESATPTAATRPVPTTAVIHATPAPVPAKPTSTSVIPSDPPVVMIITPVDGQRIIATSGLEIVELVAVVQDDLDHALTVSWHDGPTPLGVGNSVTVPLRSGCPDPLTYTITATVTDSSGGRASDAVVISVTCANPDG